MDKISASQVKNCKNLKEELQGAIYTAEKYNDVQNQLHEVENLEKWLYENTENLRKELLQPGATKKRLNHYGNKFEQKLLNIMNTREKKRQ